MLHADTGRTVESVIQCFECDSILDYSFEPKKTSRLVMESNIMEAALDGWDAIGHRTLIQMQPESPEFLIRSEGIVGFVEISFTKELLDQEAPFRCSEEVKELYQTGFIKAVMKALIYSKWVCLRVDSTGVLQVQHLLTINVAEGNQQNIFLTFYVKPEYDPEADEDH